MKTKGILVFCTIVIYYVLSIVLKPYKFPMITESDADSSKICALSMLLGLFIIQNPFDYWIIIAFIIMGGINVYFILLIVLRILKLLTPNLVDTLDKLKAKLIKKNPKLAKIFKLSRKFIIK